MTVTEKLARFVVDTNILEDTRHGVGFGSVVAGKEYRVKC